MGSQITVRCCNGKPPSYYFISRQEADERARTFFASVTSF